MFAIALTLLVLSISFPVLDHPTASELGDSLHDRLPELGSYLLSFAVLGMIWVRHHAFYRGVATIDLRLTQLNLAYLAVIAFLPYPTQVLGRYGDTGPAVALYAATIVLVVALAWLKHWHCERAGLFVNGLAPRRPLRFLWVPAVFLASIPVALLVDTQLALWMWALLLLLGPLDRVQRRWSAWR